MSPIFLYYIQCLSFIFVNTRCGAGTQSRESTCQLNCSNLSIPFAYAQYGCGYFTKFNSSTFRCEVNCDNITVYESCTQNCLDGENEPLPVCMEASRYENAFNSTCGTNCPPIILLFKKNLKQDSSTYYFIV